MRARLAALLRAIAQRLDPGGMGEIAADHVTWTDPATGTEWTYWFDTEPEPPQPAGWLN